MEFANEISFMVKNAQVHMVVVYRENVLVKINGMMRISSNPLRVEGES